MGTKESDNPLPCPMCGGKASMRFLMEPDKDDEDSLYSRWLVFCGACDVQTGWMASRDEAIALWNQRAYQELEEPMQAPQPLVIYVTVPPVVVNPPWGYTPNYANPYYVYGTYTTGGPDRWSGRTTSGG